MTLPRFKGFLQVYQLQTENDEEETWRDLVRCPFHLYDFPHLRGYQSTHGFDRSLKLVTSRLEDDPEELDTLHEETDQDMTTASN